MSSETTHVTVYTGSEVNIQYLQSILDKAGIRSLVRSISDLGSSFPVGPHQTSLQVESSHYKEAKKIAEATFPPGE